MFKGLDIFSVWVAILFLFANNTKCIVEFHSLWIFFLENVSSNLFSKNLPDLP